MGNTNKEVYWCSQSAELQGIRTVGHKIKEMLQDRFAASNPTSEQIIFIGILEAKEEFVGNVRTFIETYKINCKDVLNDEQLHIEKQLRPERTLSLQGQKRIFRKTGSISATAHFYMIMSVITMSGTLLLYMCVLVSEENG